MKFHPQSGFSLVETLVAITVLLIIIVGPMTLVATSARSTSFSSEQVVAFFLAQEGAELAQKARDDYVLRRFLPVGHPDRLTDPWANFTRTTGPGVTSDFQSCFGGNGCSLQISNSADGTIEASGCGTAGACRLRLDIGNDGATSDNRARYRYSTSEGLVLTPFTRVVRFFHTGDEIRVRSEVTWFAGSLTNRQEAVVETYLYNVYGDLP